MYEGLSYEIGVVISKKAAYIKWKARKPLHIWVI